MVSGEQIKAKRKSLKLSAKELGIRLKVPWENIYKWEKGTKISNPDDYKKIEDFVNGTENNSEKNKKNNLESVPISLQEPETHYSNPNIASLVKIIERQQNHIDEQQHLLINQQETIHFLTTGNSKKVS